MPRSIEEIDAEIAEVKARMAQRQAYGYEAARARAVLDHDPSGYAQVNQMMMQAAENKRARDAQVAAAELQRLFQKEESEKQRKFQSEENIESRKFQREENALNRAQNKKVQDRNWYEEQARMMRDLRNAHAAYKESLKSGYSDTDRARALNDLNYSLELSKNFGIPEEVTMSYMPEKKKTEKKEPLVKAGEVKSLAEVEKQQQQSGQGGNLSQDENVATNETIRALEGAKTHAEVDELVNKYKTNHPEDRTNTEHTSKIMESAKAAKRRITQNAKAAEHNRAAKEIVSGLQERANKNKKALVDDIRSRYKNGIKKWITPEYPGVEFDIEQVDDSERNWRLKDGNTVFTVKD